MNVITAAAATADFIAARGAAAATEIAAAIIIIWPAAATTAASRVRGAALTYIRRAATIWLAPFLSAIQMDLPTLILVDIHLLLANFLLLSLLLAGTFNVLRARTVQLARSMVAPPVPRASTAEHLVRLVRSALFSLVATPVPRASTAEQAQVLAPPVLRASTARTEQEVQARLLARAVTRASTARTERDSLARVVALTVPWASTADPTRVIAPSVPRGSIVNQARVLLAPSKKAKGNASPVPRASTARVHPEVLALIAPGARGASGAIQARALAPRVRVARRERPSAGDNSVPPPTLNIGAALCR